ncbi:retrovirus-related Pol polyprotein from transposon 297 [Trichonephila clavipes]|nr:retrovirus-related Pol polyprotein from transposon 297 [Trichonephila clavipes]
MCIVNVEPARRECLNTLTEVPSYTDLWHSKCSDQIDYSRMMASTLSLEQKKQMKSLLRQFQDTFHTERRVINDEVDKMLKQNIHQTSESPWSSPVVIVRKKDGSLSFCLDYRRLNQVTKKHVYPLPRINDTLDCLIGTL